jgi:hypothetical protein
LVSAWKVILATLVIYVAGIVTGALVMKSAPGAASRDLPPPPPWVFQGPDFVQQRFLDRMKRELDLTSEQVKRLEVILRESRERTRSWWEIVGPEFQAELKETRDKIRSELNPAQVEKFEKLLKERRRPQGGPGGGDRRQHEHRSNAMQNASPARPPAASANVPLTNRPPDPGK